MQDRKFVLSIAVAVLMVASGASVLVFAGGQALPAAQGAAPASLPGSSSALSTGSQPLSQPSQTSSPGSGMLSSSSSYTSATPTSTYISSAKNSGTPLQYVYIPASPSRPNIQGNVVTPGYLQSPAPFGIGAYGIRNVSGTLQPYSYTTTGFSTTLNVSSLSAFDVNSYDPSGLTVQLNTVLTNASIMGVTGYTYWTQNVMFYDSFAHQFEMVDNIWNFTSPSAEMPSGTILSHTAAQQPYPYAYIGVGPVVNNVSTPFVATLSLESAVILGVDTVFFNYTINYTNSSTGLRQAIGGVFDEVMFNSASGVLGYQPPMPVFRVDGGNVTPTGFIPYDAEVTIEGPGGGSNINIQTINGTLTLDYKNPAGQYVNVPSAYDVGSETGETSSGIAIAWKPSGVATLSSGPSLVYGMWNVSAYTGTTDYTGTISPSNAFMFVSPGASVSLSQYGYVPMTTTGAYNFSLPTGTYAQEVLMSYHSIESGALAATESITLASDSAMGVYTPLYAMDNAQAANLSLSGTGASNSHYLLYNNEPGYINPLFGEFNDYGFTVFDGVMIANTNAYINLNNSPSFSIMYTNAQTAFYLAFFHMPNVDYLGFVFYNTSNLSVYNTNLVTGAQPADAFAGFYNANMMFWNSTNDLLANSTFLPSPYFPNQISALFYNPANVLANNTVFGNYFLGGLGFFDVGLWLSSSGNLIFNNYFDLNNFITRGSNAYTPTSDLYTGASVLYADTWNVSSAPASTFSLTANGYVLSGNIVGNSTMGGNYWTDYYPFSSPYPFNEYGFISVGGDALPIVTPGPYYPMLFEQTGLPAGHSWSITMGGVTKTSTGSLIEFMAMDGSYSYNVSTSGQYMLFSPANMVSVQGTNTAGTGLLFLPYYNVTFTAQGLPSGYTWYAANPFSYAVTSNSTITLPSVTGTWFMDWGVTGYYYNFPEDYSYAGSSASVTTVNNTTVTAQFQPLLNNLTIVAYGATASDTYTVTLSMLLSNGNTASMGSFSGTGEYLNVSVPYAYYLFNFTSSSILPVDGPLPYDIYFTPYSYPEYDLHVAPSTALTINIPNLPSGVTWVAYLYSNNYYWYTPQGLPGSGNNMTFTVPTGSIHVDVQFSSGNIYEYSNDLIVMSPTTVTVPVIYTPNTQTTVTFSETGLASGTSWQVTLNGQTQTSTTSTITFTTTVGTQYYQVYSNGSTSPQSSGSLNVQGPMNVGITFYPKTYSVTFIAAGLPSGQSWTVTFDGSSSTTSSVAAQFYAVAGSYGFSVGNISGYKLVSNSTSISINGNTTVLLQFAASTTPAKSTSAPSSLLMNVGFLIIGLIVGGAVGFVALRFAGSKKGKKE